MLIDDFPPLLGVIDKSRGYSNGATMAHTVFGGCSNVIKSVTLCHDCANLVSWGQICYECSSKFFTNWNLLMADLACI